MVSRKQNVMTIHETNQRKYQQIPYFVKLGIAYDLGYYQLKDKVPPENEILDRWCEPNYQNSEGAIYLPSLLGKTKKEKTFFNFETANFAIKSHLLATNILINLGYLDLWLPAPKDYPIPRILQVDMHQLQYKPYDINHNGFLWADPKTISSKTDELVEFALLSSAEYYTNRWDSVISYVTEQLLLQFSPPLTKSLRLGKKTEKACAKFRLGH